MKQLSLFLHFFVIPLVGSKAQSFSAQQHKNDATQLAARMAAAMGIAADIPTKNIASIEKALWSVAHSELPQAQLVCQQYQIHTFPHVNLHEINVYTESHAAWVKEIAAGQKVSNPLLDEIIEMYELSTAILSEDNGLVAARFTSPQPLNVRFIAQELSMVEDVLLTEVPTPTDDGNDITIKAVQGGWMLTYSLRFDNCAAGCRSEHSWQFGVKESGEVVFVGEYGDDLPYPAPAPYDQNNLAEEADQPQPKAAQIAPDKD